MRYLRFLIPLVFFVTPSLFLISNLNASQQSSQLIQQGLRALASRNYEGALEKFKEAEQADPADGQALFLQGLVLNRLGRWEEALGRLQLAVDKGYTHPEMSFEKGWALMRSGRSQGAIREFDQFENEHPGRGQTSEFLGRTYLSLGEFDKADEAFKKALERDPKLAPSVKLYQVFLESRRGNTQKAAKDLQALLVEAPDSPSGRMIAGLAQKIAGAEPSSETKPLHLNLLVGGGYNSNVIGLGHGISLPRDISHKDSYFARFRLSASYSKRLTSKDVVVAGYSVLSDQYEHISTSDLLDHYGYLNWRHSVAKKCWVSFRGSDEFTQVGGSNFRNQWGTGTSLDYQVQPWWVAEVSYDYAKRDHYFRSSAVQDRDGSSHTFNFAHYFPLFNERLRARAGYSRVWNTAVGNDFDFMSNGFFLGLGAPLVWQWTSELVYSRSFVHYEHTNSLAGTGFQFKREDHTDNLGIQLTRPLYAQWKVFTRYDLSYENSNIPFYNYSQHSLTGGAILDF